jgi:hypothetical protein
MKLGNVGTETITGGTGKSQSFTINSSAVAFDILSSKLYNDKISAVIRELSCNAWDAHVEAGKSDIPFQVDLPTYLSPVFRVKDTGIGMSDAQVHELYCSYFASSKNTRNDLIGAMGLGSKSPFCYTDGFDIVSVYNGVKRSYNAHLSEANTPEVVTTGHEKTDEPNGVEISFPVQPSDFQEFRNKAQVMLEHFNPAPLINLPEFKLVPCEYSLKAEKWGVRKATRTHQTSEIRAIMGNVAYSIGSIDKSKLNTNQRSLLDQPLDLFFGIGDLEVTASREALSNTKRTVESLLVMLDLVFTEFVDQLKAEFDKCETLWSARLKMHEMQKSTLGQILRNALDNKLLYGQYSRFTLTDSRPVINQLDYTNLFVEQFSKESSKRKKASKNALFHGKDTKVYAELLEKINAKEITKESLNFSVSVDVDKAFVVNDLPDEPGDKYIHHMLQEYDSGYTQNRVFLINPVKGVTHAQMTPEVDTLINSLGNPPVILLSTLKEKFKEVFLAKKAERVAKMGPRQCRKLLVMTFDGKQVRRGGYRRKKTTISFSYANNWVRPTNPPVEGELKFYLIIDDSQRPVSGNFDSAESMVSFYRTVTETGLYIPEETPIYGVKANSELIKNPEWVNLYDFVATQTNCLVSDGLQKKMTMLFGNDYGDDLLDYMITNPMPKLAVDSPVVSLAKEYAECKKISQNATYIKLSQLMKRLSTLEVFKINYETMPDYCKRFKAEIIPLYPMLEHTTHYYADDLVTIEQYMVQCDQLRKLEKDAQQKEEDEKATLAVNFEIVEEKELYVI